MKSHDYIFNQPRIQLLGVMLIFGMILTGCGSNQREIALMVSNTPECQKASNSITSADLVGQNLFTKYKLSWESISHKKASATAVSDYLSRATDLVKNSHKIFTLAINNSNCFSQTDLNRLEYKKEESEYLAFNILKATQYKNLDVQKDSLFYPSYMKLSEVISKTEIPKSFKPTATPMPKSIKQGDRKVSPESVDINRYVDSRISIQLEGSSATLFSPSFVVPGYITGRVNLTNITHSPISLHAINYLVDSEGNSYAGIEMGQCVSNWQLDLNPKEFGSVTGCFQIADGTVLTKFWAKDVVTGKPIFSIPLKQTVTSN